MSQRIISLVSILAFLTGTAAGMADARILKLREDCSNEAGLCFTTLDAVLEEIATAVPPPGPDAPLLVDAGPGTFSLANTANPYCSNAGNITFRGSGTSSTVFSGGGFYHYVNGSKYAVWLEDCSEVSFESLSIDATEGASDSGVIFFGSGKSYWRDVEIRTVRYGWWDEGGAHYWWDSAIDVDANSSAITAGAFYTRGGFHDMRGVKIDFHIPEVNSLTGFVPIPATAMYLYFDFNLRMQASSVRQTDDRQGFVSSYTIVAGPDFNCVDSRIQNLDVQGSLLANKSNFIGATVWVKCADNIRIRGTQFDLDAPVAQRIRVNPPTFAVGTPPEEMSAVHIEAPYSWGARETPPPLLGPNPEAMDTYIETDCSATLCADTPQGLQHHLLSYDTDCTAAGPWFDLTTGRCRGQI